LAKANPTTLRNAIRLLLTITYTNVAALNYENDAETDVYTKQALLTAADILLLNVKYVDTSE